jgi:hypothetical protein
MAGLVVYQSIIASPGPGPRAVGVASWAPAFQSPLSPTYPCEVVP